MQIDILKLGLPADLPNALPGSDILYDNDFSSAPGASSGQISTQGYEHLMLNAKGLTFATNPDVLLVKLRNAGGTQISWDMGYMYHVAGFYGATDDIFMTNQITNTAYSVAEVSGLEAGARATFHTGSHNVTGSNFAHWGVARVTDAAATFEVYAQAGTNITGGRMQVLGWRR
jgi:hypothetical protein